RLSALLPREMRGWAIGDFRSSLPFSPSSSAGDLNNDTIAGDLPPGVLPGSRCRGVNIGAIHAFRPARNVTRVSAVDCPTFANIDLRLSKFFRVGGKRAEF